LIKCYYCGKEVEGEDVIWGKVRVATSKSPFGEAYYVKVPFHVKCYKAFRLKALLCYAMAFSTAVLFLLIRGVTGLPPISGGGFSYPLGDVLFSIVIAFSFYELFSRKLLYTGSRRQILRIERYKKYIK